MLELKDIVIGNIYCWLVPLRRKGTPKNIFGYSNSLDVEAIAVTPKRVRIRFTYDGTVYERFVLPENLLDMTV